MMIKMMERDGVFIEQQPVKDQESLGLWRQSPQNKGSPKSSGREGGQASVAKIAFFLFVSLLNYALVSWNSLSIIPLSLSDTQSRTNQLQPPGFLNPANKLNTGIQQMFLHLRHRLYFGQLAPPAGAKPACWRCRSWLCTCVCAWPPHTTHVLPDKP